MARHGLGSTGTCTDNLIDFYRMVDNDFTVSLHKAKHSYGHLMTYADWSRWCEVMYLIEDMAGSWR